MKESQIVELNPEKFLYRRSIIKIGYADMTEKSAKATQELRVSEYAVKLS